MVWQLAFIDLALAAGLLAGLKPERILHFKPAEELLGWVARVRERSRSNAGGFSQISGRQTSKTQGQSPRPLRLRISRRFEWHF